MAIKMRENNKKHALCRCCENGIKSSIVMYDVYFEKNGHGDVVTLCDKCFDELFVKSIKMQSKYNSRTKTQEEMKKIYNVKRLRSGK